MSNAEDKMQLEEKVVNTFTKLFIIIMLFMCFLQDKAISEENDKVIQPNKVVVFQMKYGEQDGRFSLHDFGKGYIASPRAFAFDEEQNIYISDSLNNIPRAQVFNAQGKFLRKINIQSKRKYPTIMDMAIKKNNLYVLLYRENIQVFSLTGQPIRTIMLDKDFDMRLFDPTRIEIDAKGNIYLTCVTPGFNTLVKYDAQGLLLQNWKDVDHYLDTDDNLYVMELSHEGDRVVKYAPGGHKTSEGTCEILFPSPQKKKCRLPEFIDNKGRMYRMGWQMFKDYSLTRILKYSKLESVYLRMDLYVDFDGAYYKVDGEGNIYTIKDDLIKYLTSE